MKARGAGHYKFINEIMYTLYSKDLYSVEEANKPAIIETEFTMKYIINYIVSILKKYTKFRENGDVNLREYLDNVFIKNVDVWGFITTYFPILELLFNNYDKLNEDELKLFEILKEIFVNYLYLTADKPIDRELLFNDLNKFGDTLSRIQNNQTNKNNKTNNKLAKSTTTMMPKNVASGIKTRKHKKHISKISFKRKPKQRRFKQPILLNKK